MTPDPQAWWLEAKTAEKARLTRRLKPEERGEFAYTFSTTAHAGQLPAEGDWRVWLVMAGRGFGKTRAGAERVRAVAADDDAARIAQVAATLGEPRRVIVDAHTGVLACCRPPP